MAKRNNLDLVYSLLLTNTSRAVNVAQLAKVVSLHDKKADVQPLALKENKKKRGMLINCWVERSLQSVLETGDVVIVLFLDRNADNFDGSNNMYLLLNGRSHSVNDSVVIGVI